MASTYVKRLGSKKLYGIDQGDGTCLILGDCSIHPEAVVKISVPSEAAASYFESDPRPPIQDLFPDLALDLREMLVSGNSPAEWDQFTGKEIPTTEEAFKEAYGPRGYTFD